MNYPFVEDYIHRQKQVRRYLALVSKTERETRLGGGRKLDIDRLHILRAGTFLILYNLIEASARSGLQAIHDDMAAKRVCFDELNMEIRREVVKGFKRNGDADRHALMTDLPVDFVAASLDVEHHFSGNVDAKLVRLIAQTYGFSSVTNGPRTQAGRDLLTIKTHRNDLAHGDKTYDEVGRNFTIRDLLEISLRAMAYVEEILDNVSNYIENEGYRRIA